MTNRDYMQTLDNNCFESAMFCLIETTDYIPNVVAWLDEPYNPDDRFWQDVAEDARMGEDEYWEEYDESEGEG